ncbi:hypothetical protein Dda_6439 [Drechslerella dactyloides]|uniref:DUF6598 domain-containing protein n=1 Tax=Drechslerella dactyloides TaxID=74499 RepID=A0AAD6NHE9_DREDA|nr:hypothetical protein Dda_6439 [Drechslerella dactyloides]
MPLIAAVKSLLNPAAPPQNHARAYLVLAQMLAEGTRFRDLLTHITTHWGGDEGALPPADMVSRQNQWSAMSAALLHVDANSDTGDSRVRIRQILGDNSATLEHLLLYIAVVLRSDPLKFLEDKSNQPGPSGSGKHRRYAKQSMEVKRQGQGTVGMPARGWIPLGRQLVQIFSVSISDPRGGLLYVFGTIKVTDCTGSYFIYNRPVGPPITMSSNAELPLNYPPYAISAEDRFTIDVDIGHAVLLSRPMVAKGTIELDPNTNLNGAGYMYEKPQSIRVNGTDRWADVKFMIMGDAAEAQIDVRMVEGDDLLFDNVYGTIVASFSNLGQTYSFTLFEKSASNNIKLNANEEVPLQRSVFAVPMKAKLKISLDLWDKDETSDDDRIGFGDCLFAPILFMSESQWVTGDTGRFEVRVSWL